jgi:hypothetical protein
MPFIPAAASCGVLRVKIKKATLLTDDKGMNYHAIDINADSILVREAEMETLESLFSQPNNDQISPQRCKRRTKNSYPEDIRNATTQPERP